MERYFILDKFNTWYDWRLLLTAKDVTPPEPKTNYIKLDGISGSLDLSESLTGEITYEDRTVTASFWTSEGTFKERASLLNKIVSSLHGKKIKIIEPDDPDHYFLGRVKVKSLSNILPYATFKIEAICEPWRYSVDDSVRTIDVNSQLTTNAVINNNGVKTLSPVITVVGSVDLTYNGNKISLTQGTYKIPDIRLYQGVNMIGVSGYGSVIFTYKEADL
jgi:hypothetical protein